MIAQIYTETTTEIICPERASAPQGGRDGQPISDHTRQFRWIVTIKENLELLFAKDLQVFIAGDPRWYPVEGDNKIWLAPDTTMVFDRLLG